MAGLLQETHWEARTQRVAGELDWTGWRVTGERELTDASGLRRWILQPPARRRWTRTGALESSDPVDWGLEPTPGGSRVVVSAPAELDTVDLGPAAAHAFDHEHHPPLTVIGSFTKLGPPADLGRYLIGGTVLDTNNFIGRRCPSEQTALSIYRLARLRGGPFWGGVATHVAAVVADRIDRAHDALPVHDLIGQGETHVRFLVDAILLLLAEAEGAGNDRPARLAKRGLDALDSFAVPWGGGTWYLHDSAERDADENLLVLNTHVHSLVARLAAGRPIDEGLRALHRCLSLTGERGRDIILAGALAVGDRLRSSELTSLAKMGRQLSWMAQASAGRSRERAPHLRLPGGWMARDSGPSPSPSYLFVNLSDLAVLERNRPSPVPTQALRAGVRYARFSGFLEAETAGDDVAAVLMPSVLANMGSDRAARRVASRLRRDDIAPAVGWPGFTDRLWPRLAPGTP